LVKFEDFDTECYILAACLKGPEFWRGVPEAWFKTELSSLVYKEFKSFLQPPYSTYPTPDLVIDKSNNLDVKLFTKEISTMNIDIHALNVKVHDLSEMYSNRKLFDVMKRMPTDLDSNHTEEVVRKIIAELSGLVNPFQAGLRERGFIWEGAADRWQKYRNIEKDPRILNITPFNIEELDKATSGGLRNGYIVCFFAGSGSYKTKVKAALAYNFSFLSGKHVMVITLEVPKEDYEHIIDSRHALLDYSDLSTGKLGASREYYRNVLISLDSSKPPLYIVDIPDKATSADLITETELYYVKFGRYPDIVILDYANEMEPVEPWGNTGEKFKNLGVEIRRIVRTYKYGFITSMQENREGKKIKDKEKVGTEHIGESHGFQNVCHLIIHLYQDAEGIDDATNQLHMSIKKNRWGPKNVSFPVFVNAAYNYVGDRKIVLQPSNFIGVT
jgi:replicative DNA helicase